MTIIFEIMKKENNTNTSSFDTFIRCWFKNPSLFRSSRPEVFRKKGVLRNFVKFTEKHQCQSLFFNKVAGLRKTSLVHHRKTPLVQEDITGKHLWYRCSGNSAKFLRTPFVIEHLRWLLLFIDGTNPLCKFKFL